MKNGGPLSLTFVALELENVFGGIGVDTTVIDDARSVLMPLDPLIFLLVRFGRCTFYRNI